MPLSTTSSLNGHDPESRPSVLPRRVRHITSIQIRNLTPFPARDALASALTQPSEQSQFTPYGRLADDLDVTVGRKRGRRISAASSNRSGQRADEDGVNGNLDHSGEPTLRRRASSRASIPLSTSASSSNSRLARRTSTAGSGPPARPTHQSRTLSHASSHSLHAGNSSVLSGDLATSTSAVFPTVFQDTSQKSLEKILQSRLVETFVTITLLPSERLPDGTRPSTPSSVRERSQSRPSTPSRLSKDTTAGPSSKGATSSKTTARRGTVGTPTKPTAGARHAPSPSTSSVRSSPSNHVKSPSATSTGSGRHARTPPSPSVQKTRFHAPPPLTSPSGASSSHSKEPSTPKARASSSTAAEDDLPVPDYISPVHWPSTNPVFQLSKYEFAPGTDLSTSKMRVEVWGRAGSPEKRPAENGPPVCEPKGKGKEKQLDGDDARSEWRVLESWDVDLSRLRPLTEDLAAHPSYLPFNTLLITLATGETFYLPPRSLRASSPSRPASPNAGYNSDPETELYRARDVGDGSLLSPRLDASFTDDPISPALSDFDGSLFRRKRAAKSASLQDILKLINLQACILDNEQSLGEIVREIDKSVVHNKTNILLREVSERQAWVSELHEERSKVDRDSEELKDRIAARRDDLRRRREVLALARQAHEQDLAEESQVEDTISEERARLASLRNLLPIIRSNLISIVLFIYPIDLVSPPDLLFTILDVPLPIPVAATDPAPPLSLPSHKDVTEDGVATALGYSAQVVQLLAAYMGHRLVYPVTCVGSRSMIKDGISAMVGPRNFPLFSKGVDTYRFEYGVFLLNKDIEMLMTERNLRALDMRHTLPNLKNLLLTLSDNEQRSIPRVHRATSSSVSISSLQSQSPVPSKPPLPAKAGADKNAPTAAAATAADGPTSARALASAPEHGAEASSSRGTTPPASGTSTPVPAAGAGAGTQRGRARGLLDLAPLTGFFTLRGRHASAPAPSSSQKPSVGPGAGEASAEQAAGASDATASGETQAGDEAGLPGLGEDEDDRKTIRAGAGGTVSGEEEGEVGEGKGAAAAAAVPNVNGDAHHGSRHVPAAGGREKVTEERVARSPPVAVSS